MMQRYERLVTRQWRRRYESGVGRGRVARVDVCWIVTLSIG
jgi:hypothetical protein